MLCLKDGWLAYLVEGRAGEPFGVVVKDIAGEQSLQPPIDSRQDLLALAMGRAGSIAPAARAWLDEQGLLQEKDDLYDPVLAARLRELDAGYGHLPREAPADPGLARLYEITLAAHSTRKVHSPSFFQHPVLPESCLRRALLLDRFGPRQRVLLVGDDDLVSVPLAALGHSAVVVDIDGYLLELLDHLAGRWDLPLATRSWDLADPVPQDLAGERFDVFLTDPIYSANAIRLFVSRGWSCLAPGGRAVVAFGGYAAPIIEQFAADCGLTVEACHWGFNHYLDPLKLTHEVYTAPLWVFRRTGAERGLIPADARFDADLYHERAYLRMNIGLDFAGVDAAALDAATLLELAAGLLAGAQSRRTVPLPGGDFLCLASGAGAAAVLEARRRAALVSVDLHGIPALEPAGLERLATALGVEPYIHCCYPRGGGAEYDSFAYRAPRLRRR